MPTTNRTGLVVALARSAVHTSDWSTIWAVSSLMPAGRSSGPFNTRLMVSSSSVARAVTPSARRSLR